MSPILGSRGISPRGYGFAGAGKPNAPVSVSATDVGTSRAYNNGAATVSFSSGGDNGAPITSYTVTSSPGGYTASGSSSPLTVTGLQSSVSYTFTVTATNSVGTSDASSASSAITATTVPQAPTIGTPTCATGQAYTGSANISVAFTAGATGGKAISSFTATSSSSATGSGASSPIAISQTVGSSYTYTVTATNANGTSTASSTSASVLSASVPQAPTIGTATRTNNTTVSQAFTAGATGGSTITSYAGTSSPSISISTSGTTSPLTFTGTFSQGVGYTFTITATNAYGTSAASSSSNSVTPYPLPTLSAFSTAANYPFNYYAIGAANNTSGGSITVGGTNGQNSQGASYYWTGSSWLSKAGFPSRYMNQGFVVATNSDNFQTTGNYEGFPNESYYGSSTASWASATFFPTNAYTWQSVGFTNSDSVHAAAQASGIVGYYRTGTGAWTATSTTSPAASGYSVSDRANNNGYIYPQNGGTSYKLSGLNGTWSASIDFGYRRTAAFAGSNIWVCNNDSGGGLVYIFTASGLVSTGVSITNGSGFDWYNMAWFGYNTNELHAFGGRRTNPPDPNYPGTNLHYKATIT